MTDAIKSPSSVHECPDALPHIFQESKEEKRKEIPGKERDEVICLRQNHERMSHRLTNKPVLSLFKGLVHLGRYSIIEEQNIEERHASSLSNDTQNTLSK